mmetsp:Transcript_2178/g.4083  ORF Transcript_2178/g.4083 Transcript_2178/m.4083 type:complete len:228 (+) Transcript_2178:712-1395(+)
MFCFGDDVAVAHAQEAVRVVIVNLEHSTRLVIVSWLVQLTNIEPRHAHALVKPPARVRGVGRAYGPVEEESRGEYARAAQVAEPTQFSMARKYGGVAHEPTECSRADGKDDIVGFKPRRRIACSGTSWRAEHGREPAGLLCSRPECRFDFRACGVDLSVDLGADLGVGGLLEADDARGLHECDVTRLHRLNPRGKDHFPDIASRPPHVEGCLVLQHEEVGHSERRGS